MTRRQALEREDAIEMYPEVFGRMDDQIATLTAEVARLKGLLKKCEWSDSIQLDRHSRYKCCPICQGLIPSSGINPNYCQVGHAKDCELAALVDTEPEEGGE